MACWPLQRFETVCVLILALLFILGCDGGHRAQNRQSSPAVSAEASRPPVLQDRKRTAPAHVFRGSVSSLSIQDELTAR